MGSELRYDIKKIAGIINGNFLNNPSPHEVIRSLLYDSRKLFSPDNVMFFAISTKKNDGHKYIAELYKKGVRNFVVSEKEFKLSPFPEANFILVNNTLNALHSLCSFHRNQFNIPVIGITGSNGKTIVKEWLFQLLHHDKNIARNPKSYNSQIGVPVSVWQLGESNDLAIFEAGISMKGEMERLQEMIKPEIGIFTNIGAAHDENFKSREEKIKEKLKLFVNSESVVYCKNHHNIDEEVRRSPELNNIKKYTWGLDENNHLRITQIKSSDNITSIKAIHKGSDIEISIPFIDNASIENAIHCWLILLLLGYDNHTIQERIKKLHPVEMRLELKEGINDCSLINDSYSSDINSLEIALDFLCQQKQHQKTTVILSDILQSGQKEDVLYRDISVLLAKRNVDRLIGIGNSISKSSGAFPMQKVFYQTTSDFLNNFPLTNFHKERILLKGARIFEFEKISEALQKKTHSTILEINLDALVNNLNYFRSKLNTGVKIMAMVKAFSYGSGSYEIANVLQFHNIDYLAVAYADEGIQLRNTGIKVPIMVMNPDMESLDAIIKYNLEPEIYNFRILEMLINSLNHNGNNHKNSYNVHIKIDTGMHRLGFETEDIRKLTETLKNNRNIKVKSIFSHLTSSEDPSDDSFTLKQIKKFEEIGQRISDSLEYPVMLHILNSAGITRFPEAQFDMVRLGISLYGISSNSADREMLQPIGTLKTIISQIKRIKAGETIGYNRKWKADKPTHIATIPVGYADGLNRKLGNGAGKVIINNNLAPIVGNVCMDMCMIDITGINASEGDEVIVFGKNNPIEKIAEQLDTIPYEILTSIPQRVKRVFYRE